MISNIGKIFWFTDISKLTHIPISENDLPISGNQMKLTISEIDLSISVNDLPVSVIRFTDIEK